MGPENTMEKKRVEAAEAVSGLINEEFRKLLHENWKSIDRNSFLFETNEPMKTVVVIENLYRVLDVLRYEN